MRRITLTLTEHEMTALQQTAVRDTRPTRDQARFILRQALGLTEQKNNTVDLLATNPVNRVIPTNP